jgi:DNA repair protein RecO (recombination protein O)
MKEERSEGIVLRAVPYSDTRRILTVLMPEEGIISLASRVLSPSLAKLAAATTPFSRSEFLYRRGRGEVHRLIDASMLDDHLALRSESKRLECAGEIIQVLLKTQLHGKPTPALYELTKAYLHRMQLSPHPQNLLASFYLKLLKHEGLLRWSNLCASCEKPVVYFCRGRGTCASHHSLPCHGVNKGEWQMIGTLADSRSFKAVEEANVPWEFAIKLKQFIDIRE